MGYKRLCLYTGKFPLVWLASFLKDPSSGCWIWRGRLSKKGYAYARLDGKVVRAHRAVYQAMNAYIVAHWDVDHLCRNRACVNPEHLEQVPRRVNFLRGNGIHNLPKQVV